MRCSPGVICNVIGEMSKALKGRIRDLGFGELLHMKIDKLDDRAFALFLVSCVVENRLRIQIGNKVLPIIAEVVHLVFSLPASGQSLPNYKPADKRAGRSELRKICDKKGLESMFRRCGCNYAGLGVSEVPCGLLSITRMLKKLTWMTGLSSHFLCLCSMCCTFPQTITKWLGWTT
jgi:hypothetical protein